MELARIRLYSFVDSITYGKEAAELT